MSIWCSPGLSRWKSIILGWIYETWKGMNKNKQYKWWWTGVMVLFAGSVYFIYQAYFKKAVFTGTERTVAVLPFSNLGSDSSDEYLND